MLTFSNSGQTMDLGQSCQIGKGKETRARCPQEPAQVLKHLMDAKSSF